MSRISNACYFDDISHEPFNLSKLICVALSSRSVFLHFFAPKKHVLGVNMLEELRGRTAHLWKEKKDFDVPANLDYKIQKPF